MAKQVVKVIKARAKGGQANPSPPLGPVLGQAGIDIAGFCQKFNEKTKGRMGQVVPVVIKVYSDRSFTFELKQSPASTLILERAKLEKGSGVPNKNKVGKITKAQVLEIATIKMPDLNTKTIESACRIIEGTARSMGVTVE
ncbi:MAG: 50S ribosomal protein L11 [Candidatus Peregrinibacteria bacterium]